MKTSGSRCHVTRQAGWGLEQQHLSRRLTYLRMFRHVRVGTAPDHLFDSPHALGLKTGAATVAVEACLSNTGVPEFILYVVRELVIR